MMLNRNAGELLRRDRADRVRHRRARRRAGLLRRQDARRPHVLLLGHAALPGRAELPAAAGQPAQERRVATNQRDGQMAYYVDGAGAEPARQLRAVDHAAGCARRPSPAHDEQGPVVDGPRSRARGSRARTTTSRPASATCSPSSGRRTTSSPTSIDALVAVRPPDPGADGLAPVHGRGRARPARRRGHRHLAPTTSATWSRWRPRR